MRIVITGGSSGLGLEIINALTPQHEVIDWSLTTGVDLVERSAIVDAEVSLPDGPIDILINCAGVNEIRWLPDMTEEIWHYVMDVNATAIFLTTQALLDRLNGGTILNIVSNASHIPMTCSLAYNASKAAAAIMTKQLARELKKTHDITVFAISPNKLAGTGMSEYIEQQVMSTRGWTKEQAKKYQLDALPAGEETDPKILAKFIAFLLESKDNHKYLAGCDIPYGGP